MNELFPTEQVERGAELSEDGLFGWRLWPHPNVASCETMNP